MRSIYPITPIEDEQELDDDVREFTFNFDKIVIISGTSGKFYGKDKTRLKAYEKAILHMVKAFPDVGFIWKKSSKHL